MGYSIYENRIPFGWHFSAVKDVCELNPTQINKDYPYATIRYIDISSVGTRQLNAVSTLPLMSAPSRAKRIVQNGDTIISTVRPNRKSFIYIKKMVPNTVVSTGFAVVRPRYIDSRYCHYVITSDTFIDYLTVNTSGSAYPAVNPNIIAKALIPVPPRTEQERIASILGALDDKIELNRQMNRTLEAIAQAIFKSWFVDFDPVRAKMDGREPEGLSPEIAALFPDRFQDSELGPIPDGWRVSTIGDIALVIDCLHTKKPKRQLEGKPLLQLCNIADNGLIDMTDTFCISNEDYDRWTSRIEVQAGDCVITNVGRVGAVAQIPNNLKAALGRNMTGVRCKNQFQYPTFLIQKLLSSSMKLEIELKTDTGTILNALNVRSIPKLRMVLPLARIILSFEQLCTPLRAMMVHNSRENQTLATIRDTLLPKLISGQIRVKDAENFVEAKL